jgi:gamma-glutamylcyclotransferase (GGCT)/AIG2-like uncharacterized protein YtfP
VKLFVYGTLMGGAPQGSLLAGKTRTRASVRGTLYALPAGYPALVLVGDGEVHGELVDEVDERVLSLIDQYEGVDEGLYERVEVDVDVGLRRHRAYTYVMRAPERRGGRVVADGRWRWVVRR